MAQQRSTAARVLLTVFLICGIGSADLVENVKPVPAPDRSGLPIAFVARTSQPPAIDGKLDDLCWKNATPLAGFRNNGTGTPAIESTTALVTYDDRALYVAVHAEEGQLTNLFGREQGDKKDVWSGDEIEFFIAPNGDGKTYYQFCVGAKFGQRYDAKSELGPAYDAGPWESAVIRDEKQGNYVVEVAIPFAAVELQTTPNDALWGFNVCRQNVLTQSPDPNWPKNPRAGKESTSELTQWSPTGLSFHAVDSFGKLFLGAPEVFAQKRFPLHVDLVLDREEYDDLDRDANGIMLIRTGGRAFASLAAKLQLKQNGNPVGEQDLPAVSEEMTSFLLPVTDLKPGTYTVETVITGKDNVQARSERTFRRVAAGLATGVTTAGAISLRLPQRDIANDVPWPVRTGVPFPKGALNDPANVRLLAGRNEIPCQVDVRARWSPRGSIRWLGLTFVAEPKNGRTPDYQLVYGNAPAAKPVAAVVVENTTDAVTVSTGPLRFVVPRTRVNGIAQAWIDRDGNGAFDRDEQVVDADRDSAPYVVDGNGTIYRASNDHDVTVDIEVSGPVHAVVRVRGWFVSSRGKQFCKYTTYYEAFAGLPHIFVNHAVVITCDTDKDRIKDVGFPVAARGDRYAVGVEPDTVVAGTRKGRITAVQDRWNHFALDSEPKVEGKRLAGWADVGTDEMGTTITGQYVPERFPKEFSVEIKIPKVVEEAILRKVFATSLVWGSLCYV